MNWTRSTVATFLLAVLVLASLAAWAGEMEPPVPPGTPTMKPIDDIEPRRAIRADMLPLTITDDGSSWYLAESISTTGAGITIAANYVTIDLMGFTLGGGTGVGIRNDTSTSTRAGTTIKNGRVRDWASHGIALDIEAAVIGVAADRNGGNGIQINSEGRFIDCSANSNIGHGFHVGSDAHVRGCQVNHNQENGILAGSNTFVSDTVAVANYRNGIRMDIGCVVINSHFAFNDQSATFGGAGVRVEGRWNRIEGNSFEANNVSIMVDGDDNVVVRNTVQQSDGPVYDIDPGTSGNYVPNFTVGAPGAPGPWDNLCSDDSCP